MPKSSTPAKKRIGLEQCVRGFLSLTITPAEKTPKRLRDQRDDEMQMLGFNHAQEMLRGILELNGTPTASALAEVRADGQLRPERVGNINFWVTG
jgi:hypothetical protein